MVLTAERTAKMADTKYLGVDMSKWQQGVDYKALKAFKLNGKVVKFAMLRFSYGTSRDILFDTHYKGCKAAGIYVGVYHWLRARNVADAREEARWLVKQLSKYSLDYPVALDFEDEELLALKLGRDVYTAIAEAFMKELEAANYYVVLYTAPVCLENHLNISLRGKYDIWLAHYAKTPREYGQTMWQFSVAGHPQFDIAGIGKVSGVSGQLDMNWAYVGYAAKIKKLGKNKPVQKYIITAEKTVTAAQLAQTEGAIKALGFEFSTVPTE